MSARNLEPTIRAYSEGGKNPLCLRGSRLSPSPEVSSCQFWAVTGLFINQGKGDKEQHSLHRDVLRITGGCGVSIQYISGVNAHEHSRRSQWAQFGVFHWALLVQGHFSLGWEPSFHDCDIRVLEMGLSHFAPVWIHPEEYVLWIIIQNLFWDVD